MKSLRYTNAILTILAVLLTLNLWTSWTQSSDTISADFATPVQAQNEGLQNAGAQRNQMIALLGKQLAAIDNLTALLKSGNVKVKVDMPADK